MKRLGALTAMLLAATLLTGGEPASQPTRWMLLWDDSVNDALDADPKECVVELLRIGDRFNGTFVGKVAGTERNAIFTGEIIASTTTSVLTLQQREPGYTCVYQLQMDGDGIWHGVWHDTAARRGDVSLRPCIESRL